MKNIRIRDLRHTHITTMLIKNKETPQAIAERLGADTRMIDNYAHITSGIQEDLAESFGKSFYA